MANYKKHQQGAILTGTIVAVAAYSLGMVNLEQSFAVFACGYAGGLAPDLDHDHSIPSQIVFRFLSVVIPVIIISRHTDIQNDFSKTLTWFVILSATIYWPVRKLFQKLTVHRGIFHSIPAIFIYGAIFFLITGRRSHDLEFQKAMGIAASLGYLTHLLLDEFSSLNFQGKKIKKSLGTALEFTKPNKKVTLSAYILCTILMTAVWWQW